MTYNLYTKILKEAVELGTQTGLTKEQKAQFLEAISTFNTFGEKLYRSGDLKKVAAAISEIAQMAEQLALHEQDDWFDKQTVNKNVKTLQNTIKEFTKTANELQTLQQRMESLYEDAGHILSRYFHINEIQVPDKEAVNEADRVRTAPRDQMGVDKLKNLVDKFKNLPGVTFKKVKNIFNSDGLYITRYLFEYGTGWLAIYVSLHNNATLGAKFDKDRVHDFLKYMESKGFGPDIFATLEKFAKSRKLDGYTTVLTF